MKDSLYIKTRLDDVLVSLNTESPQAKKRYEAMAETYFWIYNEGKLRDLHELENRLQNCYDELKCFEFLGEKSPMKINPIQEKIKILKDAIKD